MNWKDNFPKENRYFETENGILYNAEAIETMNKFPKKIFDAIITDPPYGTTACKWDTAILFEDMWKCLKKIRKDRTPIVLFGNEPFSSYLRISNIKDYKYDWIWEKSMPSGFAFANKQPMRYHEYILVFYKKQPVYNKQMAKRSESGKQRTKYKLNSYYSSNHVKLKNKIVKQYNSNLVNPKSILKFSSVSNAKGKKLHPTQKPVALMEYLIKTYTNEGNLVLDFTCGSGTTLVACEKLNRKWIGIEMEEKYCEIAKKRILNLKEGDLL